MDDQSILGDLIERNLDVASRGIVELNLEDFPEGVLRDTAKAFADAFDKQDWEGENKPKRDLDWAGEYTNKDVFLEQADIVGEYNKFSPEVAHEIVDRFGDKVQYRLARESSPAVYIKPGVEVPKGEFLSDEADLKGDELRLWWD